MTRLFDEARRPALVLLVGVAAVAMALLVVPGVVRATIDPTGGLRDPQPLFADFVRHFHAQGIALRTTGLPVQGFYYSAAAGVLFVPVSYLPATTAATLWLFLQLGSLATLAALTLRWIGPRAALPAALAMAVSVPVFHDLRWGQVSLLLLVLCVVGFQARAKGDDWWAAAALGLAIAIKLYPALLLLHFVLRRDFGFVLRTALVALVLLALPVSLLGVSGLFDFQAIVAQRSGDALREWVWRNPNSQSLSHVLLRWAPGLGLWGAQLVGYGTVAVGLAGFCLATRRETDPARRFCWLSGIAALATPTGWAHYFCFLPVGLAVTWTGATGTLRRGLWWGSLVLSSAPLASALGWDAFVRSGLVCAANLLLLVVLWLTVPRADMVE